jgi:hypothetical protein
VQVQRVVDGNFDRSIGFLGIGHTGFS